MTPESNPFGFLPLWCSHLRCSNSVLSGRRSCRTIAPGPLSYGADALLISAEAGQYRIEVGSLKNLLFYGRIISS